MDDDTYINVPRLVKFLQDYDANGMWYLGKPSISHPIETRDPDRPGVSLWAEIIVVPQAHQFSVSRRGFIQSRKSSKQYFFKVMDSAEITVVK